MLQPLRISLLARGLRHETAHAFSAAALPLPPLLDVDAVAFRKPPPPLTSPRPDEEGTDDGVVSGPLPGRLNPLAGGRPGPEVPAGLAMDHLDGPAWVAPAAYTLPQCRPRKGEID